eukprot:6209489-Pleurochrysis_carterae.AAC.5
MEHLKSEIGLGSPKWALAFDSDARNNQMRVCMHRPTDPLLNLRGKSAHAAVVSCVRSDHQQLRPSAACHELELHYGLTVSLFERLVKKNV